MFVKGLNDDKEWTPIVLNAVTECETKSNFKKFLKKKWSNFLIFLAKQMASDTVSTVNTGMCTDFSTLYFGCLDTELFKVNLKKSFLYIRNASMFFIVIYTELSGIKMEC